MHWPFAVTPLAAEYVRLVGVRDERPVRVVRLFAALAKRGLERLRLLLPAVRWHARRVRSGVGALAGVVAGHASTGPARGGGTRRCPSCGRCTSGSPPSTSIGCSARTLAAAWTDAWEAGHRAWAIHFIAIMGPYQAVEDLADLYEKVIPGAPSAEAMNLMQGYGDDLFAVELGSEALAAAASATPAVASALRAGEATREDLRAVDGGAAFVAQLDAFLAEHGHLGQACDDFILASWIEEPDVYLAELAKRIGRPAVSATRRRDRLRAEADVLGGPAARAPGGSARGARALRAAARPRPGDRPAHRGAQLLDRPDGPVAPPPARDPGRRPARRRGLHPSPRRRVLSRAPRHHRGSGGRDRSSRRRFGAQGQPRPPPGDPPAGRRRQAEGRRRRPSIGSTARGSSRTSRTSSAARGHRPAPSAGLPGSRSRPPTSAGSSRATSSCARRRTRPGSPCS